MEAFAIPSNVVLELKGSGVCVLNTCVQEDASIAWP